MLGEAPVANIGQMPNASGIPSARSWAYAQPMPFDLDRREAEGWPSGVWGFLNQLMLIAEIHTALSGLRINSLAPNLGGVHATNHLTPVQGLTLGSDER